MNLIIDQGNTLVKYAIFDELTCVKKDAFVEKECEQIIPFLLKEYAIERCMLVSVVKPSLVRDYLIEVQMFCELDEETKLPFGNNYQTPKTLGKDRLAAMAGAYALDSLNPLLVIDVGTAITFDFLHPEQGYLGGAISPGPKIRSKAMNNYTSQLPGVTIQGDIPLIGKNTEECLKSGIYFGILNEIDGTINAYLDLYPKTQVFLTGGDAFLFAKKLKSTIFAKPNLVLTGLNSLLEYNVQ